jgi:DUF2075 family protein
MQAYYSNTISKFLKEDINSIKAKLDIASTEFHSLLNTQQNSWVSFIEIMKNSLENVKSNPSTSQILLEYKIPRRAKRIDCILLINDIILVIEFKDEADKYELSFQRQVEDYSLDLRDFHKESRGRLIIPIVLSPLAKNTDFKFELITDYVQKTINSNSDNISSVINNVISFYSTSELPLGGKKWEESEYLPTPTMIEAAQALFSGQRVEEISRSHAEAENLSVTTDEIVNAISIAKEKGEKLICFVTGVPGAGKTLVGLNIVHKPELYEDNKSLAAYFSGNGPLVNVLQEAITRDKLANQSNNSEKKNKSEISRQVKTQIQNLHSFIEHYVSSGQIPAEHIAVFDEAQRCWNAEHLYNKNKQNSNRKKNPVLNGKSEPELLLEIMDRQPKWAVMIALVGNGQEINTGEAGIGEWGRVLSESFKHWKVMVSDELLIGDTSLSGNKLFKDKQDTLKVSTSPALHLKVSQRSYKAKSLNQWVESVLNLRPLEANEIANDLQEKFPIYITRDLANAKSWLKSKKRGTRRVGLIASSGARRIQSDGVTLLNIGEEPNWFLNEANDIRSSYYLELAATEFGIQGLEIDWSGLCWEADLRLTDSIWCFHKFSGTKWSNVHKAEAQTYLINKYRVLLTRAREGMVIWIPEGNNEDHTRLKSFYDETAKYLKSCGVIDLTELVN